MQTKPPTQAPAETEHPRPDARLARARRRFVRLLAAWAALLAALFTLRGVLYDPFYRGILLPIAFAVVLVAGVLTVRAVRVRGRVGERRARERRRKERRGSRE